jgi:hypothetical protein
LFPTRHHDLLSARFAVESWVCQPTAKRGTHEKAQKIWVFIKGQKVSEKCASENKLETQARRKEGSRRDWNGLNGGSRGKGRAGVAARRPP